jgi:kynurenine formamidase
MDAVHATLSRRGFFRGATAAGFAVTALSSVEAEAKPAKGKDKSGGSAERTERYFKAVIDLTHTMSPEFPTYFGVPGIELQKQYDFKKDGFNLNWWRIVEHAGTHIDAPIHFSENGATVEKIVAGELVVPLAVIDVRKQAEKDADYLMTVEDVLTWEKRFKKLPDNCCVAMMSGWGQHVANPAKFTGKDASGSFHFPGFSPELAEWLLGAQGAGHRRRHAVARQRPLEGLQDASHLAAVGPLGPGERRQSGKALARRRDARGRRAQGQGRDRCPGAPDRADLISRREQPRPRASGAGVAFTTLTAVFLVADVVGAQHGLAEAVDDPHAPQARVVADAIEAVAAIKAEVVVMMVPAPAPGGGRSRRGERSNAEGRNRGGGKDELTDHGGVSCWLAWMFRHIPWRSVVKPRWEVHGRGHHRARLNRRS